MTETYLFGLAIVIAVALVWRAKLHGDRAEAAVKAMKRIKREVFGKLGIEDDEKQDDTSAQVSATRHWGAGR